MFGLFEKKSSEVDYEELDEEFLSLRIRFTTKYYHLLNGVEVSGQYTQPANFFYSFIKVINYLESRLEALEQSSKQKEESDPTSVTLQDVTSAVSHDLEQMQKQVDNLEDGLNFMGLSQQQGFDQLENRIERLEAILGVGKGINIG